MSIAGHSVTRVLVEERAAIEREFYAAMLLDFASRSPLVLFSTEGGMDIEEIAARTPAMQSDGMSWISTRIRRGGCHRNALGTCSRAAQRLPSPTFSSSSTRLFRDTDAELIEINPLALAAQWRGRGA